MSFDLRSLRRGDVLIHKDTKEKRIFEGVNRGWGDSVWIVVKTEKGETRVGPLSYYTLYELPPLEDMV